MTSDTSQTQFDVLIIGGGINGAGIAADAAGRGLSVLLCEKSDLAGATSSWSSKLIHGGLRYLEFYEFGLVRKALQEREVLSSAAKHIIQPLAFQIPQLNHSRSSLLIRAGLFLYDNLARRTLFKGSRSVKYSEDSILNQAIKSGHEYWDAQVDDSRLVILNALQAKAHGASIRTRSEVVGLQSSDEGWLVSVKDSGNDEVSEYCAKTVVNASGPWVSKLLGSLQPQREVSEIRLVKGSHIVVPRIDKSGIAYMLQHHDGRVIFVIPYLDKYTLIGTTEEAYTGELDKPKISREETNYLISLVNLYFKKSISKSDILHTYAGVRPLIDEEGVSATKVSRDYQFEMIKEPHPLLSVYGGKVTTYRVLAESAVNKLSAYFPKLPGPWTKSAILPGGDFDVGENLFQELASQYAWLGPDLINRWRKSYGTLSFKIVGSAASMSEMGVCFGHNLYQREVDYLCKEEWARSADDILWRRSKLGYSFSDKERDSLENYISQSFSAR